ncbi:ribonuclease H-like domain-containing protein [Tanacetum coccineum]
MNFALRNHNKLDFIDGFCKRDYKNLPLANQWDMCNSVVVTWILNSLSPDLFVGAIYVKTAFEMWSDLKETYDKVDGYDVFNLHKSINSLNQNGASLAEYYNNLNSLWKQFDAMINESYLAIRSNILTREPLPLVKASFAVASGEESNRNVTTVGATKPTATAFAAKTFDNKRRSNNNNNFNIGSSSKSNSNNRGPNPNLKCTNYNKISHTIDRCFELVGYPAGYVKRNFNANTRPVSSNNAYADVQSNNVSSNNATTSNSLDSISSEQLARLMSLLNDNDVSTANANMAEYTVNILSIHKLAIDSKQFVDFDESKCYIQHLGANKSVWISNQCNGLYLFDVDNACKIASTSSIASCFVSKTLWHQRLGHPADQVLDVLKTALNLNSHYVSDHLCDTCNKAKQTREPFPLSDHKSTKIGQLVHLDVWGPYKVVSRDGFRYFLTIVDDFSRAI